MLCTCILCIFIMHRKKERKVEVIRKRKSIVIHCYYYFFPVGLCFGG